MRLLSGLFYFKTLPLRKKTKQYIWWILGNNPVVMMIKPDTIFIQEIKVLPAKAKIMDMVVIRHVSSSLELRTTLLILCEDGSLRIYNASPENTGKNDWAFR